MVFAYLIVYNLSEWFYATREEAEAELYATSYVETALDVLEDGTEVDKYGNDSSDTTYASMRRLLAASGDSEFPDGIFNRPTYPHYVSN